ncbi:MAG: hypothetical protein GF315_14485 [candidate division Zixibacteria bacterium]|nr:hypothetical protein [candidate division Zixibacteria bacterium]
MNTPIVVFRCDFIKTDNGRIDRAQKCMELALCLRENYGINSRFIVQDLNGEPPPVLEHKFAVHLIPPFMNWEGTASKIIKKLSPELLIVNLDVPVGSFMNLLARRCPLLKTINIDAKGNGSEYSPIRVNSSNRFSKFVFKLDNEANVKEAAGAINSIIFDKQIEKKRIDTDKVKRRMIFAAAGLSGELRQLRKMK